VLLDRAHDLKDEQFKKEHAALLASAAEIVGEASTLDVLQRTLEGALAELLSNPRLPDAIAARIKK
jgi:hypothetical protein